MPQQQQQQQQGARNVQQWLDPGYTSTHRPMEAARSQIAAGEARGQLQQKQLHKERQQVPHEPRQGYSSCGQVAPGGVSALLPPQPAVGSRVCGPNPHMQCVQLPKPLSTALVNVTIANGHGTPLSSELALQCTKSFVSSGGIGVEDEDNLLLIEQVGVEEGNTC